MSTHPALYGQCAPMELKTALGGAFALPMPSYPSTQVNSFERRFPVIGRPPPPPGLGCFLRRFAFVENAGIFQNLVRKILSQPAAWFWPNSVVWGPRYWPIFRRKSPRNAMKAQECCANCVYFAFATLGMQNKHIPSGPRAFAPRFSCIFHEKLENWSEKS